MGWFFFFFFFFACFHSCFTNMFFSLGGTLEYKVIKINSFPFVHTVVPVSGHTNKSKELVSNDFT